MEIVLVNDAAPGAGIPRLLLVDDSASQLRILRTILSVLKLHIEDTLLGEEAFGRLLASRFDLLITDWHMSPISGAQLLAAVQVLPSERRPKIIICSADASFQEAPPKEALDHAALIVAKPISAESLLIAVTTLLAGRQHYPCQS